MKVSALLVFSVTISLVVIVHGQVQPDGKYIMSMWVHNYTSSVAFLL